MQYNLKPQQVEFIGACEQFVAYIGGIGSGKSFSLISKALFHSQESPKNLGVIVRKNYTDLRTSTIKDFQDYTGLKVNEQNHEVKLPNGSVIMFMHGDVLESLKNINAGFIGIEQADDFGDSMAWDMLIQRLRRKVKFRTGFLVANANGHNWVWEKFIKPYDPSNVNRISTFLDGDPSIQGAQKMPQNAGLVVNNIGQKSGSNGRPNHYCVQATTYDFADILPPDFIPNLEQNLPAQMFKRYVMNSHEVMEGRVFSEYEEAKHVEYLIEIPEGWERGFVLDHGYRNPTAVLWYAIDFDGVIHLYDEHYEAEKPLSHHAERIKLRGLKNGLADPSIFAKTQASGGFHTIADEYQDLGVTLNPAVREEEYAAISRVNEFFKSGRIKVSVNLKNTREEFANWKWKPRRTGVDPVNMKEEPEDYRNHLCDCLKYLIQTRFATPRVPERKAEKKSYTWWSRLARARMQDM